MLIKIPPNKKPIATGNQGINSYFEESSNRNDYLFCGAYKGYSVGWNVAGLLYDEQDNNRYYEDDGGN